MKGSGIVERQILEVLINEGKTKADKISPLTLKECLNVVPRQGDRWKTKKEVFGGITTSPLCGPNGKCDGIRPLTGKNLMEKQGYSSSTIIINNIF